MLVLQEDLVVVDLVLVQVRVKLVVRHNNLQQPHGVVMVMQVLEVLLKMVMVLLVEVVVLVQ